MAKIRLIVDAEVPLRRAREVLRAAARARGARVEVSARRGTEAPPQTMDDVAARARSRARRRQ